jgi:hypothetical protein
MDGGWKKTLKDDQEKLDSYIREHQSALMKIFRLFGILENVGFLGVFSCK